jgi:hypothetical protein
MRTKTLLAAAAMLAAGFASSMAQSNVYSLNVVGYVNKVLSGGGKYTAIANPLNTASNTLPNLLNASLPANGAQVLKYDPSISDYRIYGKLGSTWLNNGANVTLNPGEGCLIFLSALVTSDVTNTFVGEVLQGNLINSMSAGYQLVGNMVPDGGLASSIQLTNVPGIPASQVLTWDSATQDWIIHGRIGTIWTGGEPSINVGESVLINASTPFNWVRNFTVQ